MIAGPGLGPIGERTLYLRLGDSCRAKFYIVFAHRNGGLEDGRTGLKRALVIVVAVASLVFAASSLAGNSVVTGHNAAPPVTSNLGTASSPSNQASTGTLPFTGLDLAAISGVAVLLLGGGLILARTTRKG